MQNIFSRIQWLPTLLILWNLIDIVVHVAVDMPEPWRIAGNIVGIVAALIVLFGVAKRYGPHILSAAALLVVALNMVHAFLHGWLLPSFIFIGVSLILLLRWAQVKWLESSTAGEKPGTPVYLRWWLAPIAALVGIGIVSLSGPQTYFGPTVEESARWIATAIEEIDALEDISDNERESVRNYLQTLIDNPESRFDQADNAAIVGTLQSQEAVEIVERAFIRVSSPLTYHEGYWVTETEMEGVPFPVTFINDIHIDAYTGRVTVYGQVRVRGNIIAPVQAGPGEVAEHFSGNILGMHPNGVFLNGSGEELAEAEGSGSWWVKHSWILGGEGYYNWVALTSDYSFGGQYIEALLLEDGVTMTMQSFFEGDELMGFPVDPEAIAAEWYGNWRTINFESDSVLHELLRYEPANVDPEAGPIDYTSTLQGTVVFECRVEPSEHDGLARTCPTNDN